MTHLIINYVEKCERKGGKKTNGKILLKIWPPAGEDILDIFFFNSAGEIPTWISSVFPICAGWEFEGNMVLENHEDSRLKKDLLLEASRKNGKNHFLPSIFVWDTQGHQISKSPCVRLTLQLLLGGK